MPNIYILTRSEGQYEDYHETHIIASYNIEDIENLRDKAYQELQKAFELEYPEFDSDDITFNDMNDDQCKEYIDKEQKVYDVYDIKFKAFLTVDKNLSHDCWLDYGDYDYSITTVPMIEYDG